MYSMITRFESRDLSHEILTKQSMHVKAINACQNRSTTYVFFLKCDRLMITKKCYQSCVIKFSSFSFLLLDLNTCCLFCLSSNAKLITRTCIWLEKLTTLSRSDDRFLKLTRVWWATIVVWAWCVHYIRHELLIVWRRKQLWFVHREKSIARVEIQWHRF